MKLTELLTHIVDNSELHGRFLNTLSYLEKKSNAHETTLLLFNTSNAERHHLTAILSLVRCADLDVL